MVNSAALLCLQQFADSALPIGGAAHSLGLESLVDSGFIYPDNLESFLIDYLEEAGTLEAAYCASSCELARGAAVEDVIAQWLAWNAHLGARKLARESRDASAAMGRRFLTLAAGVANIMLLRTTIRRAEQAGAQMHLALCFGLTAGAMSLDPATASAAYLQQSVTTLISCCQRLLPLGQTRAHQILWNLKPAILNASHRAVSTPIEQIGSFTPMLDIASARHPGLHTRLFMS